MQFEIIKKKKKKKTVKLVNNSTNINKTEHSPLILREIWRYQRGNQNPYIEEEQTTQWAKEKVQKDIEEEEDKQRSTKHTNKTKD
jgi:hypothetical protein